MIKKSDINEEDYNDRFGRLIHRFIARELATDPEMVERAREYLRKERDKGRREWHWWIDEWMEILERPVDQLRRDITKDSDKWNQMRIVSPLSMVHGLDFTDITWRRRAIRKVRAGLLMVRNSQYERMIAGPYQGDHNDPRSNALDFDDVRQRVNMLEHRIVARMLPTHPEIVESYRSRLKEKLETLQADAEIKTAWLRKWLSILDQPIDEVRRAITRRTEEWDWLREGSFISQYVDYGTERRHVLFRIWKKARKGLMLRNLRELDRWDLGHDGTPDSRRP